MPFKSLVFDKLGKLVYFDATQSMRQTKLQPIHRKQFLIGAFAAVLMGFCAATAESQEVNTAARKLNLNADWRFIRADAKGAQAPDFDASQWTTVSCPHTWNDIDTFNDFGTGGHQGETDLWQGTAWYRKQFSLPAGSQGKQVYIEGRQHG